jgi:putative ABC transport system permease protein
MNRDRREQDLKDEIAFHVRAEVERRVAAGQSRADALASAKRDFGNVTLVEEVTRETWGWSMQDYKLGIRMLAKYPGLTIVGGVALAIAIGIGAGWYDISRDLIRPTLPLPEGERIVEIRMHDSRANERERRVLHDFVNWRRDVRSIEDFGAYRTLERNLIIDKAASEPVIVAEITASAFRVARVPPVLGRPLLDADEQPGAPDVVVLGHGVWQRWFDGRTDVIGRTLQLGRTTMTVVGVMPEGFAFPVNHRLWVPLQLRPSGYAPLEGAAIRVFGRLMPRVTHRHANAELDAFAERAAADFPQTHLHLRPEVLAYGGEPQGASHYEIAITHLPILLVLIVACTNVGTLFYARTATREAEIAMRYALGASRGRILAQLFVEALVLASLAAVVGLTAAHWGLKWGLAAFYSGQGAGPPFWISPGLKFTTMLYAAGLTIASAAMVGVLPAVKATGARVQTQVRNLGSRGSTLRFGSVWTTAMIVQVTLTVICLPPAIQATREAVRDRMIRARFPAGEYLAVRAQLDRETGSAEESQAAFADRMQRIYEEWERQVAQEPGVTAVTFADRLPGMEPAVRRAEVEASPGAALLQVRNLWTSAIGRGFFEAFEKPIVSGRAFHEGDRAAGARTVIVNEAFARRFTNGSTPVGGRVRYAANDHAPEPWFDIVGMVRDIGMTPTNLGEAPYVFHAALPDATDAAVMGVRVSGDPATLAPRIRAIAAELDPGLRVDEMRPLDDMAWRADLPMMAIAGTFAGIVGLGLFVSASGIFTMMSVTVARRTREIGLRAALGASHARLIASIFARPVVLIGAGIVAGHLVLLLATKLEILALGIVVGAAPMTSAVMLTVGLLACVEPARRALRINPTDALKEV